MTYSNVSYQVKPAELISFARAKVATPIARLSYFLNPSETVQPLQPPIVPPLLPLTMTNETATEVDQLGPAGGDRQFWFLLLIIIPVMSVLGNVLVIMAVRRERALQSATNYFIVSLALADLLVSAAVMPFAVYVQVNGTWGLPTFICDLYIATDVTSSTCSIFNLVAISVDRYIAITQPIKYAKHKNHYRVTFTIALVWITSAAIGVPLVLGLNVPSDGRPRDPLQCVFYNSDFIIYSSITSFYIPCCIMVFLYYKIFKAIRQRARQAVAGGKQPPSTAANKSIVIGNVHRNNSALRSKDFQQDSQIQVLETSLGSKPAESQCPAQDSPSQTNVNEQSVARLCETCADCSSINDTDECQVITNKCCVHVPLVPLPQNNSDETSPSQDSDRNSVTPHSPESDQEDEDFEETQNDARVFEMEDIERQSDVAANKAAIANENKQPLEHENKNTSMCGQTREIHSGKSANRTEMPRTERAASKFALYKTNRASRKKREKIAAKRERKATKTLAIVLGVFLVCWVPFFTCNVVDAVCMKLQSDCNPGLMAFFFTTWIGYMNSAVNPIIYTIFNLEFRKAFKRLLGCAI